METLTDKNGTPIPMGSIIYNGRDYYSIYFNERLKEIEAISCTQGYMHDVRQSDLDAFELIGPKDEFLHLLECD